MLVIYFRSLPFCAAMRFGIRYFLLSSQIIVAYVCNVLIQMVKEVQDKDNRPAYGRTIKYLGIFGGAHGLSMLLNMLRTKVASVLLGVAGQSIIALSNRTVQMFSDGTGLSLAFSAVRKISDTYENGDEAAVERCVKVARSIAFLTGVVGMLIMLLLTPLISDWMFEESSAYYMPRIMMLSPVVFFMSVSNGEIAVLRGTRRLNKMALYTLLTSLISVFIAVPAYFLVGIGGIFPAILITAFLQMCLLLWFAVPHYKYRVSPFSISLLREGLDMVKMGAGYIFSSIFTSFSMWLVCALLSDIGDGDTAGLFSAGFMMITILPGMLFAALDSEFYPRLSGVVSKIEERNGMINEQAEVQLLVQSPLLMAFVVAMPLLVPLFYKSDFMPAVAMAQFAMFGMFMRAMTFPLSFLSLAKNDTLTFVLMEALYNIMFVALIVGGYLYKGLAGVGVGIALLHVLDFALVYSVTRFKYGMRLSQNLVLCFMLQMPLFVLAVVAARLPYDGWLYWFSGIVCVLLSLVVTMYMFSRLSVIPESVSRLAGKIIGVIKRK